MALYFVFLLFYVGISIYLIILLIILAKRGIIALDLYIDEKNRSLK